MQEKVKSGVWLLDKPVGITSRKAADLVSAKLGIEGISHTGTLDPQASGLLILLAGKLRKIQEFLSGHSKEYVTTVQLGASSDTGDSEGTIQLNENAIPPTMETVQNALLSFSGKISQTPPSFSAVRIKGQRAYDLVRRGKPVHLSPREIEIHSIEIVRYQYPELCLDVRCSAGTYIRSLAKDIGEKLGTSGYVHDLRRLKIGNFHVNQAFTLDKITETPSLSLEQLVDTYPKIILPRSCWHDVKCGKKLQSNLKLDPNQPAFLWLEDKVVALANIEPGFISTKKLLVADIENDI